MTIKVLQRRSGDRIRRIITNIVFTNESDKTASYIEEKLQSDCKVLSRSQN